MLKKNKNLVICLTPLQMLIASIIIKNRIDEEEYVFICICYNFNEKYNEYYREMSKNSSYDFLYQISSVNKLGRFFDLIKYKRKVVNKIDKEFNVVYLASIDNPFVQLTLSKIKFKKMITFDDGTANLWANSVYNKPVKRGLIQRILSIILGITFDEDVCKEEIEKHYTVFKSNSYLREKSEFLPLFNFNIRKNFQRKMVKIFLGQPLLDYKFPFTTTDNIEKILNFLEIDFYFPHPMENKVLFSVKIIKTNKIFEDYILELLNSGFKVEVYTFFSSAALTVCSLDNVKVFAVVDDILIDYFQELYEIFVENGVAIVKLGDELKRSYND